MMKKLRKFLSSPAATVGIFVMAVLLLLGSSIGGARAALTYFSETYSSRVEMYDIGVTLLENGNPVSWRNYVRNSNGQWDETTGKLLENMLAVNEETGEKEPFRIGQTYNEALSVTNSGTINEYVRVSVYKYWLDPSGNEVDPSGYVSVDGQKIPALSPDKINLNFVTGNGWEIDDSATTDERTVLYYSPLLETGASTPAFTDTLTIDGSVAKMVHQDKATETGADGKTYTTITTTYDYDGFTFQIRAEVDAVQEHNADDAALSAWGRRMTLDPDAHTLTLQ